MRYFLIFIFLILISCSSFKEAGKVLRNEKTNTTDEFLVKKKNPLKLPPNFDELPMPNSENEIIKNQNNGELKSLLNNSEKNYHYFKDNLSIYFDDILSSSSNFSGSINCPIC